MTRSQRIIHRRLWLALGPVLLAFLALALAARPPIDNWSAPAAATTEPTP